MLPPTFLLLCKPSTSISQIPTIYKFISTFSITSRNFKPSSLLILALFFHTSPALLQHTEIQDILISVAFENLVIIIVSLLARKKWYQLFGVHFVGKGHHFRACFNEPFAVIIVNYEGGEKRYSCPKIWSEPQLCFICDRFAHAEARASQGQEVLISYLFAFACFVQQ